MKWNRTNLKPHVFVAAKSAHAAIDPQRTAIAADKVAAYLETHYSVRTPEPITLRIGVANERVVSALRQHRARSCAFVTAYNPCGTAIADADNLARHESMLLDLKKHGCAFYEGAGGHPDNGWPEEKSCLCFGLSFDDACDLGAKWGQDAIVWCDVDGVPQLVLLR